MPTIVKRPRTSVPGSDPASLIALLKQLRNEEKQQNAQFVQNLCEQGRILGQLKSVVEHGRWEKTLVDLDYHPDTARRLIQLSESSLLNEIQTLGQDLDDRLSRDAQRLVILSRLEVLGPGYLARFLTRVDSADLSRVDLSDEVDKAIANTDGAEKRQKRKKAKRHGGQAATKVETDSGGAMFTESGEPHENHFQPNEAEDSGKESSKKDGEQRASIVHLIDACRSIADVRECALVELDSESRDSVRKIEIIINSAISALRSILNACFDAEDEVPPRR